jgi:peptidoglycan-N-acetylglucosamine deacetylase
MVNAAFIARQVIVGMEWECRRCFMVGSRLLSTPLGLWSIVWLGAFACFAARVVADDNCPGHPDAIGTSRTIVVDPREHPRIGTMQYGETLPLRDHEVVLTFDDGPLPRNSNQVLQILADNCVKATFFTIGEQALASPEGVRKLAAAGHNIGTHTQHHPLTFDKMSIEKETLEIDGGLASASAALTDPSVMAPFFRFPGLLRARGAEDYLASKGIQVWSADFLADDWRHIPPQRVYELAIKRLDAYGKGILLLHDIQARTVAALPKILHELKARGYHIVQVLPATPERPATPTEPQEWLMHPPSENVPIARWPKVPNFFFAEASALAAPALADFDAPDAELLLSAEPFERVRRLHSVPLPREAPWPREPSVPQQNAVLTLPVPAASLFEIPEKVRVAFQSLPSDAHHAEADEAKTTSAIADRRSSAGARQHGSRHFAHGGRAAARHQVHASTRRSAQIRVASLKKR